MSRERELQLEGALRELLEFSGNVAIRTVGDVRLQAKLIVARQRAQRLLDAPPTHTLNEILARRAAARRALSAGKTKTTTRRRRRPSEA